MPNPNSGLLQSLNDIQYAFAQYVVRRDDIGHANVKACIEKARELVAESPAPIASAEQAVPVAALTVWYGSMPESNGKTNWTAILHNGDMASGMTIDRSEYPDRVRYAADRVRWLIGDLDKEPWILDYDADKHSGYTHPAAAQPSRAEVLEQAAAICENMACRPEFEPEIQDRMLRAAAKSIRDLKDKP